ncbi:BTB/POZ and MATH domain-containing protein 1-like [Miscanthus floridulus]|uniref:BTB/POZ and MATH domain-containing protein 1-like n=1 Tax=Miscanthus floridulus TaxID=154761 RepID=UPI00345912EB
MGRQSGFWAASTRDRLVICNIYFNTFDYVDTRTFAAHRGVLMARSPVFHAELSLSSSLKTTTNNNNGAAVTVVQIDDMEAQDFEAFLHYMYTDSLPPEKAAAMLPDLVAAANRYQMERLRLVCEDRLSKLVDVTTVAVILAFAVEHHCLGLKEACLRFLEDPANLREFVKTDGLEHLSTSCPSVLKDMITKLTAAQEPCSYRSDDDSLYGISSN